MIKEELSWQEEKELQIEKVKSLVAEFNKQTKNSLLKLEAGRDGYNFQFFIDVKSDKYLDKKTYDSGNAIIYIADAAYKLVESIAKKEGARNVSWNNTGTIGWI